MMEKKTLALLERLGQVEVQLGSSEAFGNSDKARDLAREYSHLNRIRQTWESLQSSIHSAKELRELLKVEQDQQLQLVIREEIALLSQSEIQLERDLRSLLIPPNPDDNRNTIVELRAGTGGAEAALFVADCTRMYQLFADRKGWKWELLSATASDLGGFKEYIMVVVGEGVYRTFQHEAGTHRVQRVPATETQGRVHTSAITVAILLEPGEDEAIALDERDLRIDTYRSSGAGGQHVNCTDSAVRITHLPTNVVVHCQEERSQHKNRDKAMRLLKVKLAELQRREKAEQIASTRASQVGSGDRSERIRTYNFAQNRLTDHRGNFTLYRLEEIMNGDLDELTGQLSLFFQKQLLGDAT